MKRLLLLLPVVLFSVAVGFIVYRSPGLAEGEGNPAAEINVSSGAQYSAGDEYGSAGDQYGAPKVPADIHYTQSVSSVVFSHQVHAVELGYGCNTCHGGLFQMQAHSVEARADFNMQGLAQGKYCGSCHSSSTRAAAFSSETQCARCHSGVKGVRRTEGQGEH